MSQGFLEEHPGEASERRLEKALLPAAAERARDLAVAGAAAVAGGVATLRHCGDMELAVERKEGGSPVTEADHASNRAILSLLAKHRPDDAILSEESGADADPSPSEESGAGEARRVARGGPACGGRATGGRPAAAPREALAGGTGSDSSGRDLTETLGLTIFGMRWEKWRWSSPAPLE